MKNNRKDKINELDKCFSEYGGNALEWRRKCELMLPEIVEFEVWKEKGCSSVYEYAAKKAGMSRYTVNEALRVLKQIENMPELMDVAVEKGIGKVKPVATVATRETAGFWADKMRDMSKNVAEMYVRNYKEEGLPGKPAKPDEVLDDLVDSGEVGGALQKLKCGKKEVKVTVKLRVDLVDRLKKQGDLNEMMEKFLDFVEGEDGRNEGVEGLVVKRVEKPEPVRTKSRHVPVKIRRYVKKRSGGKCAFPGCCRDGEILHHKQRFALEKVHDPDRMVYLCSGHERLVHLGLIEGEDGAVEEWKIRGDGDFGLVDGGVIRGEVEDRDGLNEEVCKNYVDRMVWLNR